MSFKITVDEGAGILRIRYSGEVRLQQRLQLARQVLDEARRTGIHRWLLDFRDALAIDNKPDEQARQLAAFTDEVPRNARLAYLVRYDHQLESTIIDAIGSRGVKTALFTDSNAAIAWLRSDDPVVSPVAVDEPASPVTNRAYRLVGGAIDPSLQISARQLAVLGELAGELLDRGLEEAAVKRLVRNVSAAMTDRPAQ